MVIPLFRIALKKKDPLFRKSNIRNIKGCQKLSEYEGYVRNGSTKVGISVAPTSRNREDVNLRYRNYRVGRGCM